MKSTHLIMAGIFLICSSFLVSDSKAPNVKLKFGQVYELPAKHFDIGFIGNLKDGFIQVGYSPGKSISLQKFSPALKFSNEKLIDLKGMPKGFAHDGFLNWDGHYYWLYNVYDKKAQTEHFYVQQVDINKGDLIGSAKEYITCKRIGSYDKLNFSFSSDSSKMFIYTKFPNAVRDDSKNYQEYGCWVYGPDMKLIWSQPSIKMPYTEKKMDVRDIQGDRDGNLLFLSRVFNDESKKEIKDDSPNFHFEILKFSEGKKTPGSVPFKFEDKYVSQVTMLEDQNANIVCCGFYSNKDKNGKLKANRTACDGSFFLRLDPKDNKLQNVHKGFYEIPNEVFKMYESNKLQKKMEKKEDKGEDFTGGNLVLRNVVFGDDGSLLVVGEEYYTKTVTYNNGRTSTTHTYYYYNDIYTQYIDDNGNLGWTKKIPKKQTGVDYPFNLGFRILPYNGSNYIFFFDNIKNLNPNPGDDVFPHSAGWGGVLMAVKLDKSGDMSKKKVFDVREIKEWVNFMDADKISDNTLICRASEGAQFGFFGMMGKPKPSKICLITVE